METERPFTDKGTRRHENPGGLCGQPRAAQEAPPKRVFHFHDNLTRSFRSCSVNSFPGVARLVCCAPGRVLRVDGATRGTHSRCRCDARRPGRVLCVGGSPTSFFSSPVQRADPGGAHRGEASSSAAQREEQSAAFPASLVVFAEPPAVFSLPSPSSSPAASSLLMVQPVVPSAALMATFPSAAAPLCCVQCARGAARGQSSSPRSRSCRPRRSRPRSPCLLRHRQRPRCLRRPGPRQPG